MVFLVTPDYNADGNEKFALTNRQRQNGPVNGMGTRANAQNLNINRDYMKLDTPEARAFVKLWNDYDPQIGFDLHTSDGSAHGYLLTYSPGLNPDTSPAITRLMTDEWFPFVTKNMKAKHGWDSFYYGNVSAPGGGRGGRGRGRGDSGRRPARRLLLRRPSRPARVNGARSSTSRVSTTTTSASGTGSRCSARPMPMRPSRIGSRRPTTSWKRRSISRIRTRRA